MTLVADTATLVHGYTMADIERCARAAGRRHYTSAIDEIDKYDCAWHAVVELLYTTSDPPTFLDLINAGAQAVRREIAAQFHHGGFNARNRGPAPRFVLFWGATDASDRPAVTRPPKGLVPEDFTDRIAERMALPRILSLLSDFEYQAISALAIHGTRDAAADAIGISRDSLNQRVRAARRRILEAWLAPENPPAAWRRDETCKHGHGWAEHGFRDKRGMQRCRVCARTQNRRSKARNREQLNETQRQRRATARVQTVASADVSDAALGYLHRR